MKFREESRKGIKVKLIQESLKTMEQLVVFAYLICMLGIFPLFYKEQYYKIGDAKFEFFWRTSILFIGATLVLTLINTILKEIMDTDFHKTKEDNYLLKILEDLSFLDFAVLVYAICVVLSYVFSDFKEYGFMGAPGWQMGLCSQMFFVAIYFILSKQQIFCKSSNDMQCRSAKTLLEKSKLPIIILIVHLVSSSLTFLFGIFHRFEIDPLGMYIGLNLDQKIEFLSTIGQATWFSGYVCTVFAVGVTLFYSSDKLWIRIITGIYSVISFGILVTQNSDSAFIAIAGILLLLGYFSLTDIKKCCRFWQIICLMWGTFGGIGILQKVFVQRAVPLDSLSTFFSQSGVTWLMFAVSLAVMLFYQNSNKKVLIKIPERNLNDNTVNKTDTERIMKITKTAYKSFLVFFIIGIVAVVLFIYLNTKGYLFTWFGYQTSHPYLYFDYHWGSNRGSTWIICWQAFLELPLHQKLFGVGPDSLAAYFYSMPELSELLQDLWGNLQLTNAHNEYLNSLLCYGIVGVSTWLAVLIGGIRYFYMKAKEKPFMIAFALCIMGYACHNIFCYQQVCATTFLFIALGMGESLTKSENFNTIK